MINILWEDDIFFVKYIYIHIHSLKSKPQNTPNSLISYQTINVVLKSKQYK
jgi:hypothetical protein